MRRDLVMVVMVAMVAMASVTWAQPAAAETPPPATANGAPAKPRPMATTADELFPPAKPATTARPAAPVIPPSLLIRPPGSAPAPYGKGPSATKPVASVAAGQVDQIDELAGYGDANATSNFIAPTAIMPPAGSFAVHSYELFVLGISYSPSSIFSMSAQTLVPVVEDGQFFGIFSGKLQLHRSDAVRFALHGTAFYASGNEEALYGLAGGVVTFCFERACDSHFSGYAGFGLAQEDDVGVPLILSGGFVGKLGKTAKLLVELDTGHILGEGDNESGLLAIYGLRLGGKTFALDAGFAKPLGEVDDGDLFPLGLPLVNFSIRP